MTLVTARYDWQKDRLMTGQSEIARLWSVDPRTVKRDMARMREMGWLVLRIPAAKGRVACYGLGLDAILRDTRPHWDAVGPDFLARMAPPSPQSDIPRSNVVAFVPNDAGPAWWQEICAAFQSGDTAAYSAWIAPMSAREVDEQPTVIAPTTFHANYVITHYADELDRLARRFGLLGVSVQGPGG